MSLGFIMAASIFRVDAKRKTPKATSSKALISGGGRPQLRELVHRLQDGTRRPCLHTVTSAVTNRAIISGKKVVLFDESTYTEEMIAEKTDPYRENSKQFDKGHKPRKTCVRIERKQKSMKLSKTGLKKYDPSNGRRVMKHSANVQFGTPK